MSKIVLVAETGSDIPVDLAEKYGIYLVPMHVSFGKITMDDGSFPVERIGEYYSETGTLPKTSGSSPADFQKVFEEIHAKFPEKHILHLAYSAATTCSYQSAVISGSDLDYVTSIDTKQVSVGQAAIVIRLAQVLETTPDLSPEAVIEMAVKFCHQARMCFLPGDLEYLRAGGRVSNVAFLGGRLLHLHPCIEVKNGLLMAEKKYRGNLLKIVPRLIQDYSQKQQLRKEQVYFIYSIGLSMAVRAAAEIEAKACGFQKVSWIQTGCVITTHGGPGAFGIVGFTG